MGVLLAKTTELVHADAPRGPVRVRGWVRTVRDQKEFAFVEVNDGSGLSNLQVVAVAGTPAYEAVAGLATGSSVDVTGEHVESPAPKQKWEVRARDITVLGSAGEDYPLQKKRHSDEFLRTIAHLRPRTNKFGALFRIRSKLALAIHRFFDERGFVLVHTPIITPSDCEGAGELFALSASRNKPGEEFFGKPAYLTVSGQLAVEMFALALGNVYTFGPTFRAENSHTSRHAAEFWMVEPEMAFCDLAGNMDLAEEFVRFLVNTVQNECAEDLSLFSRWVDKSLDRNLASIADNAFVRLSYHEAVDILKKSGRDFAWPVEEGADLQTEHERYLAEEHCGRPVIVHDWPASIKPFYMRLSDDEQTVGAMDVLVPRVGEIIGGSQREERYDVLQRRMTDLGLDPEAYWWYLDSRRHGSVIHSGFGLGFERLIMMVTGVTNIRDTIAYPRTPGSLEF